MLERTLQMEESKAEIIRQGSSDLVDATDKLAHSVLSLAANKNQQLLNIFNYITDFT